MKLFVSHASLDRAMATDVAERIRGEGFDVWMAEREVRGGQDFAEEIMRGLDECDGFVLLLTPNSNGSPHVKNEVNQAVGRRLPILPLLMERFEVSRAFSYYLAHVQWVDATDGLDRRWNDVVDVLGAWRRKLEKALPMERCSHEEPTVALPPSRPTPGTVEVSGFEVLVSPLDRVSWESAVRHAKGLRLGGHDDWQLPSRQLLLNIRSAGIVAIGRYFLNQIDEAGDAVYMSFEDGHLSSAPKDYSGPINAIFVRPKFQL